MSAISLMPFQKKIKLKKDYKFNMISCLGDATQILKDSGMLIGRELIFDEGTKIRVEGFSGSISDKSYPSVKISIYPEGKKQCQVYVNMGDFDGVTWETIEGENIVKDKKEVQKIHINFRKEYLTGNYSWKNNGVWPEAISLHVSPKEREKQYTLNPTKLSKKEIDDKEFKQYGRTEIGEAVVKKGKSIFSSHIVVYTYFTFSIEFQPGFMFAKIKDIKYVLRIGEGYIGDEKNYVKVCDLDANTTPDFEKIIIDFLKKKYELNLI